MNHLPVQLFLSSTRVIQMRSHFTMNRTNIQPNWGCSSTEYHCVVLRACVWVLSRVRLFVTPWSVTCQAPLSMGFPGKNTGVGCHFLLQGIFPTQGSNQGLLHRRQILYQLKPWGSLPKHKMGFIRWTMKIFSFQIFSKTYIAFYHEKAIILNLKRGPRGSLKTLVRTCI